MNLPLRPAEDDALWHAQLYLQYAQRGQRTVMTGCRHSGPLRVQKPLYPEGTDTCHTLLLHPPAGIAAGDRLRIEAELDPSARVLFTTPGASKWYRSNGGQAQQGVWLSAGPGAVLEWLPQESIVFDRCRGQQTLTVELAAGARFLGLDVLCLGRVASGEVFSAGTFGVGTAIDLGGRPIWREWGTLRGGSPFLHSAVGLQGFPVCATVLLAGMPDAPALAQKVRAAVPSGNWGASGLPDLLVVRWLGDSTEAARLWFLRLWEVLRPVYAGQPARLPRIWTT